MKVKDKERLFQITRLFGNLEKAPSKRNGKKQKGEFRDADETSGEVIDEKYR